MNSRPGSGGGKNKTDDAQFFCRVKWWLSEAGVASETAASEAAKYPVGCILLGPVGCIDFSWVR
jgi:hypothetical protein